MTTQQGVEGNQQMKNDIGLGLGVEGEREKESLTVLPKNLTLKHIKTIFLDYNSRHSYRLNLLKLILSNILT